MICLIVSSIPRMYADDTSITFAGSDVDEINSCINRDLPKRKNSRVACSQQTNFKYDKDRIPTDWFEAAKGC